MIDAANITWLITWLIVILGEQERYGNSCAEIPPARANLECWLRLAASLDYEGCTLPSPHGTLTAA